MRNNNSKSTGLIFVLCSLLLLACSCTEKTVWVHENCTDPKAITLNDGSVLVLSTNDSYLMISKYNKNWDLIYIDIRKETLSYDGNAQLLQTNQLEIEPLTPSQLYLGFHLRGVSTSEYLLSFQDKFANYSTYILTESIYNRKNYVALQNGYILLGSMTKSSTSSKYIGSISSYPEGLFATKNEFVSDSDQLSCFETQKNDFYCVYISEDTPYITKIALKEWKLQCAKYEAKTVKTEIKTEVKTEEKIEVEVPPGEKIPFDVLYLIDATGSMYFAILDVQLYCKEIANKLRAEFTSYDIKFGVVFYRDLKETPSETSKILDFTSNMDEFQSFVDSEDADGGGDANEDWVEAYSAALDRMSWRNGLKTIIHIADLGAHGEYYSTIESDPTYYKDEGKKLDNLARRLCDTKYLTIQGFYIYKEYAGYSFERMNQVCKDHRMLTIKDFNEKDYETNGLVRQAYYDDTMTDPEYFITLVVTEVISSAKVCTLSESSEQIIKIGHKTYSYLQASAIDDSTMGIILLSPKKTCSCASETTTTTQEYDLFFMKTDIHDVDNIYSYRYEFLYDKCLYEKDSTLFDPKFITMSEKRILVVCVSNKKVLHVMAITEGVKEIKHFDISATKYRDYLSPSFVRFGQSIGLVFLGNYIACSRNYTNIQVISYPSCIQLNKVIVPIHLTTNITFTDEILNDYLGTITSHYIYIDSIDSHLTVKSVKTGLSLQLGEMKDDDTSYTFYSNNDDESHFIYYTAMAQDSVDGLIEGKTGYAEVITPKCWPGCYSCWENSTEGTNNCLIECNQGYYSGKVALLHSTYPTPFIYGPLFSCYQCDYRCSECEAGPIAANGTSAGMEFNYSNCKPQKCAEGYYYVEDDETTCLSKGEDKYRYSIYRKIELYLDINVWRIKVCHKNCQNCTHPGTDAINYCTKCIPNYHFIFGEGVPEPGNCFTGLEVEGYYVNATDDKWHLCNESMEGCEFCENGDVCIKCKDGYGLLAKNYQCQALPINGSFVENKTIHTCEYHLKGCAECTDRYKCTKCQYPFALNRTTNQCESEYNPPDIVICDNETQTCKFCDELMSGCYRCRNDSELICNQCKSDFTMYNSNNKECVDIEPYKCVDDFYTLDGGINYYPCEDGSIYCKAKFCKKGGVKLTGDFNNYKDYQEKIEDSKDETTRIAVSGGAGTIKIQKGIRYIVINSDVDKIHLIGGYFYVEVNNKVKNITLEKAYCNLYINGEVNELNLKNEGFGNVMIYGTVNKIYINDFYPDIYANYLHSKVDEITFDWTISNLYVNERTLTTRLNYLTAFVEIYPYECGNVIDTCINNKALPDYKSCDKCGKTFAIYDNITVTQCGHVFHKDCFEKSSDSDSHYDSSSEATYETSLTCPKCNEELKY